MQNDEPHRRETEALIQAIWGPLAAEAPPTPLDPTVRDAQNRALAIALEAYLKQYLSDA